MTYFKSALAIAAALLATSAMADVTFYQNENFAGQSITATTDIRNFERFGFNDRASSVVVRGDRDDRWEVCEDARFEGRCVVLRPGQYASVRGMGLNDRISSVRMISVDERIADNRYAPVYAVAPVYTTDYRRRPDERLYEARVTTVRAVVGTPQQRCWIEREQVGTTNNSNSPNLGGAVAGALIGGILGHQIGGGSGKDAATALGVVGGAALGANSGNYGNYGNQVVTQDVQRCTNAVNQRPDYYDVGYIFEGREHRVQLQSPPQGSTIIVNSAGEPRS